MTWRDILPIHPAAELFPLMSPDELRELGEDIVKNGLTSPIVLWQGDLKSSVCLLDGRNRLDAIELARRSEAVVGAPSITAGNFHAINEVITLDKSVDPWAYVISANMNRRHLMPEQRRELIAKLIKREPDKSDRQIAATVKASPTTVGTVRAKMEAKGDVSKLDTRTDTKGRKQPASKPPTKPAHRPKGHDAGTPPTRPSREYIRPASVGVTARLRDPVTLRSKLDDWELFSKAASVLIKALEVEGRKNMATMSPATVAVLAGILRNLLAQWPDLPPETKRKLAAAKTPQAVSSLVPTRPQIATEFDEDRAR
jgi:hypothetical protein